MAFTNWTGWWPLQTSPYSYSGGTTGAFSTGAVWSPPRLRYTKLRITGTHVVLEDEYGNGLEIALDVLRRLMKFDEVEALAALEALR